MAGAAKLLLPELMQRPLPRAHARGIFFAYFPRMRTCAAIVHVACAPCCSAKVINAEATAVDNALKGADWNGLIAMHRNNDLPAVGMSPFLVTA